MSIKPVLVPDHDAAALRGLMDRFADASTGPTRQQLAESRAAVAAAQGVAESDPLANRDAYAKQHQQGQVYKTHYPKGENPFHKAGMKDKRSTKMSAYDISNTGPKGVLPESDVAEGSAGAELKAIDGDYYEDSTDFFSMFDQDHFDREEESEDGMEIRGYIDDVCVMVFKFSTPDRMGGWGNYDDSALIAESGVEDDEEDDPFTPSGKMNDWDYDVENPLRKNDDEEGEVCPECDGAGCPECYGEEDRDRAHDHAQGMERESAGMAEAGRPDVMRHRGDTTVKVVKRAGKPIGEIGIDAEASEGNGQYYVKLYDGSYDAVGFDTAEEALAELKAAISEGITETADVKYGVFAKGGSVGSQRFRDDPLKTFDTKEEAVADARRRRSGLSKGERGYYRMGYVVKPIKGEVDEGMIDSIKNTVRAANYDRLARRSNSQAVAGGGFAPPAQFKSLSAKGDQRAQKAQDIRKGDVEEGWKSKLAGAALAGAAAFGGGGAQANDQIAKDTQAITQAIQSGQMKPREPAAGEISPSQIYSHPKWRETVQAMIKKYPKNHEDDQRAMNAAREAIKQMIQQGNVREGSAQQVDEKSEAIKHGNNDHNVYHHVDESVDPVEQLRADIKRFSQ